MELRDYLRGLRRYWVAVVLMTIAGVLVAAGWASMQKPLYQATASAYISTPQSAKASGGLTSNAGQQSSYQQSFAETFVNYAGWVSTAEYAIKQLGLTVTPEAAVSEISVTNVPNTAILEITATATSPEAAARLADAWIKGLQVTIDKMDGTGKAGSAAMNVYPGNPAQPSSAPVFPDWKTALLVGGVVGLGFGVAFALARTASDRRIRSGEEVTDKLGHAVVGTIPDRPSDGKKRRGPDTSFAFAESLRVLRTNLQFMDVDNPPRTIVVTSPIPGDGKSTVAVELARTLAASGTPTVLVDGDLRRPTVAKKLGLPAGAGLSDVLAGRAEVTDLLQRVPGVSNLLVLTAGMVPPNPSEILGSARMHNLISYLATEATVIIDAPPLLPVTDGAILAHQADGALLVVSAGKTTYDLAGKALEALERARGRALGIVINKAPMRGADASPYAYAYYAYYSHDEKPAEPASEPIVEATPVAAAETPDPVADVEPSPQPAKDADTRPHPTVAASSPHVADDPFAEIVASKETDADDLPEFDDLEMHDVFTPLLDEPDLAPRTTRNRSRRS